jgi:uncharacterized lipoprotein YddW (UPF0748 family)
MKKIMYWNLIGIVCCLILLSSCQKFSVGDLQSEYDAEFPMAESPNPNSWEPISENNVLLRGVWLSYLEFDRILQGNSEEEYRAELQSILSNLTNKGYNTIFAQVRSHGDAYYPSDIFPWSSHASGTAGKACSFDPLQILLDCAKEYHISVHAWVNPYRLMNDAEMSTISDEYLIKQWYQKPDYMAKGEDGYWYLNPGKEEVTSLIISGIQELLSQYPDLDGIQFDDYFYDRVKPETFGENTQQGKENISDMIQSVYRCVKEAGKNYLFGISPAGNFTDHPVSDDSQLTNLSVWCTQAGYLDYVAPQIYWELDHPTAPFQTILEKWEHLLSDSPVTLYVGLAAYKFAGTDILDQEVEIIEQCKIAKGYIMFRYDNIAA